jgi:uncharacterized protein (UPF0147 family)
LNGASFKAQIVRSVEQLRAVPNASGPFWFFSNPIFSSGRFLLWFKFLHYGIRLILLNPSAVQAVKTMDIKAISNMLDDLVNDSSIPKNIRRALSEAKTRLDSGDDINVKVSAAIYVIESITEDINMPAHARTQIWAIMSSLETLNERP